MYDPPIISDAGCKSPAILKQMEECKMNGVPVTIDSIIADITIDAENGITWNPELYRKQLEQLVALSAIGEGWIENKRGHPLPPFDEYVIWLMEDGNMFIECLDKDGHDWIKTHRITHWRKLPPLPNPPSLNTNKI